MKRIVLVVLGTVLASVAGLLLFAWSGIYNVAASTGHFRITAMLLELGMRSSVRTHALGLEAPRLDDPALFERGLGHFQSGCAPCHGAPGVPASAVAQQMVPHPPDLSHAVTTWTPERLFWIVKHGLKYTGMPAWPAVSRDDEVWAMVAFLKRLPAIGARDYRRMALLEVPGDDAARTINVAGIIGLDPIACARCHGVEGQGGAAGGIPRLAGQRADYLEMTLQDYRDGRRPSGIMHPPATALSDADGRKLAAYFAAMKTDSPGGRQARPDADLRLLQLGGAIADAGVLATSLAACEACHGPQGRAGEKYPGYPAIAGQHRDYLEQQLKLFRAGVRGGKFGAIMTAAVRTITDEQIAAVALYYARLPASE